MAMARTSLTGVSAGTATVKICYHYQGQNGTYDETQEIPVTIAAHANAISSINAQDSLSLNAVDDCEICKAAGVQHQEDYNQLINVTLNVADSDYSMTDDQSLQVSSSDESVVQAQVSNWSGINPVASLSVKVGKPGDAVLTISAAISGKPTGVRKTISVHVGEQVNPVLNVAPEVTVYKDSGVVLFGSPDASNGAMPSLAYYEDNGAMDSLARYHVDLSNVNRYQGWTYAPVMANFATAASDNEDVLSISQTNNFTLKKPGMANVTVTDIWGNEGVCKVTVKDVSDVASKLSLTKSEMTVERGQQIDLQNCIGGLDSLTGAERNAIGTLAFTSSDNGIATFKCDGTYGYANIATNMITRNLGDVTVMLNYSGQDVRSTDYYNGNWNPISIGSMTIHVVEPAAKATVDAPTAPALAYTGSEQVGVVETADYAVSGGKATDAGQYTATLSLKDKDGRVWSFTGTSDDIAVKWNIAAASMGDVEVSGIEGPYAFTGKAVEPAVRCSFNGKALVKGKDYELAFSDNVSVGEGEVTIAGKGNFAGQVAKTFSIEKSAGEWRHNASGWWYDNGDGTYPQSCWQEIGGARYYFNASGYMVTGWLMLDGSWYYLSGSGAMLTGWQYIGGTWYWLDESGVMATGWRQIGDDWYCFEASGAMKSSCWVGDYYLTAFGAMAKSTTVDGCNIGLDGKCQYVYWVQDGDTYHLFLDCPKLKDETNIIKGSNAAAGDRKPCMTCGR